MNPTAEQLAAIDHPRRTHIRIEAGPGSGKTYVLAERAARFVREGVYRPDQVAMLTYTRSMAVDLVRRAGASMPAGVPCPSCGGAGEHQGGWSCSTCSGTGSLAVGQVLAGTIHSVAARLIRQAVTDGDPSMTQVLAEFGWLPEPGRLSIAMPEDVTDLLGIARSALGRRAPRVCDMQAAMGWRADKLAGWPAEAELRRQLAMRSMLTYDDVLELFEAWLVARGGLCDRFPALFVDEAQDLTDKLSRIIALWAPETLTMAGDSAQAIFGFLGMRGDGRAPDLGLPHNHRSGAEIVGFGAGIRNELVADGACHPLPGVPVKSGGQVWWRRPEDQAEDVETVVAAIVDAGASPKSVAVIAPTWAELEVLAERVASIGLPVHLASEHASWTWATAIGRALVGMARIAANGFADDLDLFLVSRAVGPMSAVTAAQRRAEKSGRSVLEELGPWWQALTEAQSAGALAQALDVALGGLPERVQNALTPEACAMSPRDWLMWIAMGAPKNQSSDGVTFTTVHGAKGLEWSAVVVASASEGLWPPPWRGEERDDLEWGRALYVACTRASELLVVISPRIVRDKPRAAARWLPKTEEPWT